MGSLDPCLDSLRAKPHHSFGTLLSSSIPTLSPPVLDPLFLEIFSPSESLILPAGVPFFYLDSPHPDSNSHWRISNSFFPPRCLQLHQDVATADRGNSSHPHHITTSWVI